MARPPKETAEILYNLYYGQFDHGNMFAYRLDWHQLGFISAKSEFTEEYLEACNKVLNSVNLKLTVHLDSLVVDKLDPLFYVRDLKTRAMNKFVRMFENKSDRFTFLFD